MMRATCAFVLACLGAQSHRVVNQKVAINVNRRGASDTVLIGCFADDQPGDRDLPNGTADGHGHRNKTLEQCQEQCRGFVYFGRQANKQCFCGNSYGKHGESRKCTCNNAAHQGLWANCVYKVNYVGCYEDKRSPNRLLEVGGVHGFPNLTKAECRAKCKHYKYYGREWNNECYCGNELKAGYEQVDTCTCDAANQGRWSVCAYKGGPFIGCFADDQPGDRDLPNGTADGHGHRNKTWEQCKEQCKDFKYFSKQANNQCFCGNSYGKHGESPNCTCDDQNDQGSWVNCVYDHS